MTEHKEVIECMECGKMTKNNNHGGKRKSSGRPKLKASEKKENTKVVRIPVSKEKDFRAWLTNQK